MRQVASLQDKLDLRRRERELDRSRTEKRRQLYDMQDRIDAERDRLLSAAEAVLAVKAHLEPVFLVAWTMGSSKTNGQADSGQVPTDHWRMAHLGGLGRRPR
ncbi:MAG: hypothetical protein EXR77_13505 [Myxococcales bacterium]|nr:hypothetical protein [Myxococcales bacterium]